jgi:hypothetical protein
MAEQKQLDFEISVSTRLAASAVQDLDRWADSHFSDRSKTLKAILSRVLAMVRDVDGFKQGPGDVVRRLYLKPA